MTEKENMEDKKQKVNVVEKIIDNQTREIQLKEREQDVRLAEIQANKELACKNIEAQEKVMINNSSKEVHRMYIRSGGLLLGLVILFVFIAFAITHDAKDIVIELVKYIVPLLIGGFGGFYFGKTKGRQEADKN
ncbi:hypothetical protein [Providencia alcalifaciens]|uniref:hypothetical protein n=1 Tax=Providencia alcalifaciens TaxID=126385 RepID=UPI0024ABA320|nr:hypothetical protein [Providencia rettgeri]